MKIIKKFIPLTLMAFAFTACKKQAFVDANTDPGTIYSITPQEQFLSAVNRANNNDRIFFYDNYRKIMPWMQMLTDQNGNGKNFLTDLSNFNVRYSTFFPELGAFLTDVQMIIEAKPEGERAAFQNIYDFADIMKIQYALYVSEINGSIPYTGAFKARYTGELNPAYEKQQELFQLFDSRLQEIVSQLTGTPAVPQEILDKNDPYFKGDPLKWAKAANALRLRLATRWLKRDQAKATEIITSALASSAQMESNDDSWVLFTSASFTSGGDWAADIFRAPRPTVDFMWKNSDPRIRIFYMKNEYTEANFELAKDAGLYDPAAVWNPRQYVGAPVSPDSVEGKFKDWFSEKKINDALSIDTLSYIQPRLWQPSSFSGTNEAGTGTGFFPTITYAEYCLMRAEFIERGITGGSAEEWYNKGIEASLRFYDARAAAAMLPDYTPLTDGEISDYLATPDVKYDASKGLEQIITQAYLNFFKQPNEAWANYKRTGMPNSSTALANETITIDGTARAIPRRAQLTAPAETDQNFDTKTAALQEMATDPAFGQGPGDGFGRTWWDVE